MTQKTLSLCVLTALILMTGCTSNKGPQPMVYSPPSAKEAPRSFTTMMEDSLILTRIKTKLFSDDLVDGKGIDILVRHGVVYLTGQAMDDAHRRMAMDIIRTVEGVVRIENQLTIGSGHHI
ncbi:MAG: BON domain-containing protein [Desulfobacter sp.]|nr:MAG: BON domain-containing protein [Desulfobacter sp.]